MQRRQLIAIIASSFGMHNSTTCRHQVNGTRPDGLDKAQAIPVHHLASEQVSDRCEADVRVRPYVDTLSGWKFSGTHVIKKNEWPDHAALRRRQHSPHSKAAEITTPWLNEKFNGP
jgi:hypothetical protein